MRWGRSKWRGGGTSQSGHTAITVSAGGFSLGQAVLDESLAARNLQQGPDEVDSQPARSPSVLAANVDDLQLGQSNTSPKEGSLVDPAKARFVVPRGYRISGAMFCPRGVQVCGEAAGKLLVVDEVSIAAGGVVSGVLNAKRVVVYGDARGPVRGREIVEVHPGGRVLAPVTTPALQVALGGILATDSISVTHEAQGR